MKITRRARADHYNHRDHLVIFATPTSNTHEQPRAHWTNFDNVELFNVEINSRINAFSTLIL